MENGVDEIMLSYLVSGGFGGREFQQSELARLIERFTPQEGVQQTAIAPLHLFRSSAPLEPIHGVYKPVLCLVAQGRKRVTLADASYTYDTAQYLLVAVDLPVISYVTATPQEPLLSLSLEIDPRQISALIMDAELPVMPGNPASQRGIILGCLDSLLLDAVIRLLRLLETSQHIAVLAPHIIREILYLLLVSEQGAVLHHIAFASGKKEGIVQALHWLKSHFAEPMQVEALARKYHMSPSVFHHHFKSATAMTPLQYQKRLRLEEACRLMLEESVDVGTAGFQVGYESSSQFSREYRRLFGDSPRGHLARLREAPSHNSPRV